MHLLIDADSAIYKAGLSNETRTYIALSQELLTLAEFRYKKDYDAWLAAQENKDDIISARSREVGPLGFTLGNVKRIILDNMLATPHTSYQLFVQGEDNFRYDIYSQYKANRDPDSKPVHIAEIKKYLVERWGALVVDGEETDDRVSWLQCTMPVETCIVSIDKDLLNTPGWHYNYDTGELFEVSEQDAELHFARQLLTGDSTDNIPGLPRVGKKTAEKILPEWVPDWMDIVKAEYDKKNVSHELLERNGILLWMRREPNEMWSLDRYE